MAADNTADIIPIKRPQVSSEGWGQREQDALLIARLSAMPALDYERARVPAARQLNCRVSWLDQIVANIHERVAEVRHHLPAKDGKTLGTPITFWYREGKSVTGFLVGAYHHRGEDCHLLILSDGNATIVESVLLPPDELAELKSRKPL